MQKRSPPAKSPAPCGRCSPRPTERRGWRLAEQRAIRHGETAQLAETVLRRDVGDSIRPWIRPHQRTLRHIHSPQPQVAMGTHSKMFLAIGTETALSDANLSADLENVERFIPSVLKQLFEAAHCPAAGRAAPGLIHFVRINQTGNCRLDESLLNGVANLWDRQDIGRAGSEGDGRAMYASEPGRETCFRSDNTIDGRRAQFTPVQRASKEREIRGGHGAC